MLTVGGQGGLVPGLPGGVGGFDRHDGVRAGGQGRAGHDPGGLAGTQRHLRRGPGRDVLGHGQRDGRLGARRAHVFGAQREPVHAGIGEGGQVEGRLHVLRQDAIQRFRQGDGLSGQRFDCGENARQGFFETEQGSHDHAPVPGEHGALRVDRVSNATRVL